MLTVYTGPMSSGKTSKLIDKYLEYKNTNDDCIIVKPEIDNRYSENYIISKDSKKVQCYNIRRWEQLERYMFLTKGFFIDEAQFISGDIKVIPNLIEQNKDIFITGLNLTTEREIFGDMGYILCMADNIEVLTCDCEECGGKNTAKYSFYKGNKTETILIGDENYVSVCPNCYKKLISKR